MSSYWIGRQGTIFECEDDTIKANVTLNDITNEDGVENPVYKMSWLFERGFIGVYKAPYYYKHLSDFVIVVPEAPLHITIPQFKAIHEKLSIERATIVYPECLEQCTKSVSLKRPTVDILNGKAQVVIGKYTFEIDTTGRMYPDPAKVVEEWDKLSGRK